MSAAEPQPVGAPPRGRLGRFLSEPMWVLGLVLLTDEVDKNIIRGLIHPLQGESASVTSPSAC